MIRKNVIAKFAYREICNPIDEGDYLGNQKCHANCLNYALKHPENVDKILGCMQVFAEDEAYTHFVVRLKDGRIIDPTYGRLASKSGFYLIVIEEYNVDGFVPDRELDNLKKFFYSHHTWWQKLFLKVSDM